MSFIGRHAGYALSGSPDRFGIRHATPQPAARAAFAEATEAVALHRPHVARALDQALAADPGMVAAHALRGLGNVILARPETMAAARAALAEANAALAAQGCGTEDELALLTALEQGIEGRLTDAAGTLDQQLARNPTALLLVKLSHGLRFMAGDLPGMRRTIGLIRPAWHEGVPGYGAVLGCHAFTLEESGEFGGAVAVGKRALEIEPRDVWALHAVAHAHEMRHETAGGIEWIERRRADWTDAGNFAFHLAWHLALFHLDRGDHARVLDLYDREIRPTSSEDFRDVANAVSLLWRLGQHGVAVGRRWDELATIARRRRGETTLLFASLHHLLALLADGDMDAARDLVTAVRRRADTCPVARDTALPLAQVMLAMAAGKDADRMPGSLQPLGGSHAQRDVFVRTLALHARGRGDAHALATVLAARRRLKRDDSFTTMLLERDAA